MKPAMGVERKFPMFVITLEEACKLTRLPQHENFANALIEGVKA